MAKITSFKIPGVKKIWWVDIDQIYDGISYQAEAGAKIAITAELNDIDFQGEPDLKWDKSTVNNKLVESSSIKFESNDEIDIEQDKCFIIEVNSGGKFLMGNRESKPVVIKRSFSPGSKSSRHGYKYEIAHIGEKSLIRIVL